MKKIYLRAKNCVTVIKHLDPAVLFEIVKLDGENIDVATENREKYFNVLTSLGVQELLGKGEADFLHVWTPEELTWALSLQQIFDREDYDAEHRQKMCLALLYIFNNSDSIADQVMADARDKQKQQEQN